MKYDDGQEIKIGDEVQIGTNCTCSDFGTVVVLVDQLEAMNGISIHDWDYLKTGFIVKLKNGEVIHYDEPDGDLILLSRK